MPTARSDLSHTDRGVPVVIAVLANDSSAGLSLAGYSQPASGAVVANPDQSFTYTPAAGFEGTDSFTYTVRDTAGAVATGTVTITVSRPNAVPAACDDVDSVNTGESVAVSVLANDNDPDGDALQVVAISAPGHGTVQLEPDKQRIRYTPQTGFLGLDSFAYTVADGHGGTSTASVTVTIRAPNMSPVATADLVKTLEGTPVTIDALANDNDPDGNPFSLTGMTLPGHGTLTLTPEQRFAYTPAAGFIGLDSFTYTIKDSRGATATGTVTVEVQQRNTVPTANPDRATSQNGQAVTLDLLANDIDPDGDRLQLAAVTLPIGGRIAINPDQTVIFTPAVGFSGSDSFTYTISDGRGGTAEAVVTIDVTEPVLPAFANGFRYRRRLILPAQAVAVETAQDFVLLVRESGSWLRTAADGGRLASAQAFDLRFELADGTKLDHDIERYDPAAGTLTAWIRLPSWQLTSRLDLFLYYGKSGLASSEANPAGAWAGYLAVWNTRTGADRTGHGHGMTPTSIGVGQLLGECGDYDGTASRAVLASTSWGDGLTAITAEAWVQADRIGHDGAILVGGPEGATADSQLGLTLRYDKVGDTAGAANTIIGRVQLSDGTSRVEAPADSQSTGRQFVALTWQQGQAARLWVDDRFVTPSNVPASKSGTTDLARAGGSLYLGYTPNGPNRWPGLLDQVRIKAAPSSAALLTLQWLNYASPASFYGIGGEDLPTDANQSPVAMPATATTTAGNHVDLDLLSRSYDPDNTVSQLTFTGIGTPAHGVTTVIAGRARYTPIAGYVGSDSFTYTIGDGSKQSTALVAVAVTAPVLQAVNDTASAISGQALTLNLLTNDQGGNLSVIAVSDPPHGTTVLNPDSTVTYRPDAGYVGSDSFAYTVTDGISRTTGQVAITVTVAPPAYQLPTAPIYDGSTFYVSPSGSGISTSRSAPGAVMTTINGANDGSIIVFLDGTYSGSYSSSTPKQTGRIKLIAETKAFTALNTVKRTSIDRATIAGEVVSGINNGGAIFTRSLYLQKFNGLWVEGFRCSGAGAMRFDNGNAVWLVRNRYNQVDQNCVTLYNNKIQVVLGNWMYNDRRWQNMDPKALYYSTTDAGWISDYGVRVYGSDATYITGNFFQGAFNQPASFKQDTTLGYVEQNLWVSGDVEASGANAGCSTGLVCGQECDDGTADNTVGTVYVRNNTWKGSRLIGCRTGNVEKVYFSGNNYLEIASVLHTAIYVGKTASSPNIVGPRHPKLVDFRNNYVKTASAAMRLYTRGRLDDQVVIGPNTTPGNVGILNSGVYDSAASMQTSSPPAVTRETGSGFAVPTQG